MENIQSVDQYKLLQLAMILSLLTITQYGSIKAKSLCESQFF